MDRSNMTILGLDVGSSSIKAGIVRAGRLQSTIARASYPTHFDGVKAEVDPAKVLKAIQSAITDLGPAAQRVDAIGLSVMSPAWIAMDAGGNPLTRLITHQDRRSVDVAKQLEARIGKQHFLRIAGNRPFPGGISVTTLAWHLRHERALMRKADLVGHLNTFLHRQLTQQRVVDPSNASFMGLYETVRLGGWSKEICQAVGISLSKLPRIVDADRIAGSLTPQAARRFGLRAGTPVMTGMVDTGAATMLFGPRVGRLLNVSGSTDVLCLCTDHPRPHDRLLTRALGIGKLWLSVATLAATGSAIQWAHKQLFAEMPQQRFYRLVDQLARQRQKPSVQFEPYLAGERTSIDQRYASFSNLTLASTREQMLAAMVDALARASAERLTLLQSPGVKIESKVSTSGGAAKSLHRLLYRDWPGRFTFTTEPEASLRGLSKIDIRPME
jgi:sugar (pentulose or hexulose) kinase